MQQKYWITIYFKAYWLFGQPVLCCCFWSTFTQKKRFNNYTVNKLPSINQKLMNIVEYFELYLMFARSYEVMNPHWQHWNSALLYSIDNRLHARDLCVLYDVGCCMWRCVSIFGFKVPACAGRLLLATLFFFKPMALREQAVSPIRRCELISSSKLWASTKKKLFGEVLSSVDKAHGWISAKLGKCSVWNWFSLVS